MPAGTRIAVLELRDRLRVVQDFTSDQTLLLAAVDSITFRPVPSAIFTSPPAPPAGLTAPDTTGEACGALNAQSELTVNALQGAASFLAGVQGRKNLIWFTPGIQWLTSYSEFSRIYCLRDYTAQLQRDYGLLTAARVALYPVDPRGLANCDPRGQCSVLTEDQNSMREMAEATGGAAYYNRNDLAAAAGEAIATGADYYSLSYIPPLSKYDGQYHRIDVKVDRPGVHLQFRDGYTAIDLTKPPKKAKEAVEKTAPPPDDEFHASMTHGAAPSSQLRFYVRVTPSTARAKPDDPSVIGKPALALKGKPLVRYDFLYAVLPSQITFASEVDGQRQGSIEFVMIAYDAEGNALNVLSQKGDLSVSADRLAQSPEKPLQLPVRFDLPPGDIFVRVGLRDAPSGNVGTLEIPLTVDKRKK
jgi:VWFA-related protein